MVDTLPRIGGSVYLFERRYYGLPEVDSVIEPVVYRIVSFDDDTIYATGRNGGRFFHRGRGGFFMNAPACNEAMRSAANDLRAQKPDKKVAVNHLNET